MDLPLQNDAMMVEGLDALVNLFAEIPLPDEAATQELGRRLAPLLRPGDVMALAGDLGAGKTTLARALLQARADKAIDVPSPTFTLAQIYDLPGLTLWHFDLYRLENAEDVYEIGWEEALSSAALLVEWPERLGRLLPPSALTVSLSAAPAGRLAQLNGDSNWQARWQA